MISAVVGFIQWFFGCEYNTAVEIYGFIIGCGLAIMFFDISESLKRIAERKE